MPSPTITTLPFVQDRDGKRCFWAVKPTGDYTADCRTGQDYALRFLDYSAQSNGGAILQLIVPDMPREQSGIEIGFWSLCLSPLRLGNRALSRSWLTGIAAKWSGRHERPPP